MYQNIMIDVETLSTLPNAAILQIAAVKFKFKSDDIEIFCKNILIESSIQHGLAVDKDTIAWWKTKPLNVIKSVTSNAIPIDDAITNFIDFIGPNASTIAFWANGMNMDFPIIESTCRALGIKTPWRYYNLRDARTVYAICNLDWKNYPRIGSYHNGLDDCLTQVKALKECLA